MLPAGLSTLPALPKLSRQLRAFFVALEQRDPTTGQHDLNVSRMTWSLGRHANLPDSVLESLCMVGLMHDIGKVGVPMALLTKPAELTLQEFQIIQKHSTLGFGLLSLHPELHREATAIRHHHERWDGRGYPDGLAGKDIPALSRIIHVIDAMDAMLSVRSYKQPYPLVDVAEEIRRCTETQFDPLWSEIALDWLASDFGRPCLVRVA
jgi:HD-GYP domain-containing protein (c-di-GMP phosphodiesterase class II)